MVRKIKKRVHTDFNFKWQVNTVNKMGDVGRRVFHTKTEAKIHAKELREKHKKLYGKDRLFIGYKSIRVAKYRR